MKKVNKLKVLLVTILCFIILSMTDVIFATSITNMNTSNNAVGGVEQTNASANQPNGTLNNTPVNNVPMNTATNSVLPDTGTKTSTVGLFVLIILTSISAIYTYIKIRKYNV